jgi:hypothetical protein
MGVHPVVSSYEAVVQRMKPNIGVAVGQNQGGEVPLKPGRHQVGQLALKEIRSSFPLMISYLLQDKQTCQLFSFLRHVLHFLSRDCVLTPRDKTV